MNPNRETLFDLISIINDNWRVLQDAALSACDPVQKARCRRLSRVQASTVARVVHAIADHDKRGTPLFGSDLAKYVDDLVGAYTGDCDDNEFSDRPDAVIDSAPPHVVSTLKR